VNAPPARISIAMCTCNGAAHLGEQLESIRIQSRQPDELVVFDDGSTDDSAAIVDRFRDSVSFSVRAGTNPQQLGPAANFGRAIAACTGDVIVLCDQDDIWLPEKLTAIAAEFTKNSGLAATFSDAEVCGANGEPLGYRLWNSVGFTPSRMYRLMNGHAFEVLLRQNMISGCTLAFASRFRPMVLPIGDGWMHDGWIGLILAAVGKITAIERPLVRYRQHAAQSVGALRRSLYQQYLNAKKMDAGVFDAHANMYQSARDRMTSLAPDALLRQVDDKIRHFRNRAAIHSGRKNRYSGILGESLSCRYMRYSMGWKSLAQDLFL
jgi:glycosyltransferase involved in cell wall biosynthesis